MDQSAPKVALTVAAFLGFLALVFGCRVCYQFQQHFHISLGAPEHAAEHASHPIAAVRKRRIAIVLCKFLDKPERVFVMAHAPCLPRANVQRSESVRTRDGTRSANDWTGALPIAAYPQSLDPAQGYLASANQQPIDPRVARGWWRDIRCGRACCATTATARLPT